MRAQQQAGPRANICAAMTSRRDNLALRGDLLSRSDRIVSVHGVQPHTIACRNLTSDEVARETAEET
jgi:hypothetical protein